MPIGRDELSMALDAELCVERFKDYCPNGLQVEGKAEIAVLVSGVTACQALLDRAVALQADAILVHHGYFWPRVDHACWPDVNADNPDRCAWVTDDSSNIHNGQFDER